MAACAGVIPSLAVFSAMASFWVICSASSASMSEAFVAMLLFCVICSASRRRIYVRCVYRDTRDVLVARVGTGSVGYDGGLCRGYPFLGGVQRYGVILCNLLRFERIDVRCVRCDVVVLCYLLRFERIDVGCVRRDVVVLGRLFRL